MKKYYNIIFMISSVICIAWCIIGVIYIGRIDVDMYKLKKTRKDPFILNNPNSDTKVSLHLGLLQDSDKFLTVFQFLSKIEVNQTSKTS